jgi:hypothetical protein
MALELEGDRQQRRHRDEQSHHGEDREGLLRRADASALLAQLITELGQLGAAGRAGLAGRGLGCGGWFLDGGHRSSPSWLGSSVACTRIVVVGRADAIGRSPTRRRGKVRVAPRSLSAQSSSPDGGRDGAGRAGVVSTGGADVLLEAARACPAVAISVVDDETGVVHYP